MSEQFRIFHAQCPNSGEATAFPFFRDLTRPRDPQVKLDHEFNVYKCISCGLEISVHYKEKR